MLYLEVPFAQKEIAKQQGARWDPLKKKWYVPDVESVDLTLFQAWLPQTQSGAQIDLLDQAVPNPSTEKNSLSLSQLLNEVHVKLQAQFSQAIWVRAEIANLNERRGHIYLELSENNDQGQALASCRAMIWASSTDKLLTQFEKITGSSLKDGQKVLVQVQVNFHEKFGFSLVIQDIDPSFTLGEIEANLIAIREKLIKEGIYHANKRLVMPQDFFRVAVISPPNAAGLGDFRAEADGLQAHQLCEFVYFHSAFQGDQVRDELLAALRAFNAIHQKQPFDALVIIRGGGAKLDLNPLNQYELAQALTAIPIPVLTGIGHERDNTILDEVAHTRFDTPSKVIYGISQRISQHAKQAKDNWLQIESGALQRFHSARANLNQLKQRLENNQSRSLLYWQHQLSPLFTQIQSKSQQHLALNKVHLDALAQQIQRQARLPLSRLKSKLLEQQHQIQCNAKKAVIYYRQQSQQTLSFILSSGPQTQLKRGFALAKTQDNQPISSAKQALKLDRFKLAFADGDLQVCPVKTPSQIQANKEPLKP
ncbi:exodeoxyribonuclease VII large subunit [Thiomicrospira sp. R3]|uniref:exodeoxyribonuclease VII large subunit n=1 Tax=Thiomicrospira sp. R3 TaxID=3035472 RepID=UPI00259BC198|nr:exodeoxyribonuclease VII large subunit [Thiomicrospira sp. R3]WFE68414.1 exodeoxyribonuclease VII large subunit [Thiomicrospira sp. R3]